MSSAELLHVIIASLAMVSNVGKDELRVVHYLRQNKILSVDIDVCSKCASTIVGVIGENIVNNLSPLHLLPELRHLYRRAVFHVLASERAQKMDETIATMKGKQGLPLASVSVERLVGSRVCSVVKLPNIAIQSSVAVSSLAFENTSAQPVPDKSYLAPETFSVLQIQPLSCMENCVQVTLEDTGSPPCTDSIQPDHFDIGSNNGSSESTDKDTILIDQKDPTSDANVSVSSNHSTPIKLVLKKANNVWDNDE